MKKKTIIFISAVIVLFIALIFITGKFPPPSAEETGGTIGKVEKYRKVQMTEKDIILRSEVTSDTSKLAKSIYGLMVFNAFAKDYSEDLKVIGQNMEKNELSKKDAKIILDYSGFVEDNRKSVENVIGLLSDIYSGDTTDYSIDIEKKLIDFDNFVKHMSTRDSLVTKIITGIEKTVKANPARKDEEFKKLQDIHDHLLIKKLQLAMVAANESQINVCAKSPLFNITNLSGIELEMDAVLGKEQLQQSIFQNKNLLACFNATELKNAFANRQLGITSLGIILGKEVLAIHSKPLGYVAANAQGATANLGFLLNYGLYATQYSNSSMGAIAGFPKSAELQNTLQNALSIGVANKVMGVQGIQQNVIGSH